MKTIKWTLCGITAALTLSALTGCSHTHTPQLANELHFPVSGICDFTISYDDEAVTFYEANSAEVVIKEYMTENKDDYYAHTALDSTSIHICEGGKPWLSGGFTRYVEVYLPTDYCKNLTVTTTDGDIDFSGVSLALSTCRLDSTSGKIQVHQLSAVEASLSSTKGSLELGSITADSIRLETTSGAVSCEALNGDVTYTTTSGDAVIKAASGSGSYTAGNSGKLDVVYTEVSGALTLFNKNGSIHLTLPSDLSFAFEATTKNGSISTNFQESLSTKDRTTRGTIGSNPSVTVQTSTNNGDITVSS